MIEQLDEKQTCGLVPQIRFVSCGGSHGMHCDYITITKNVLCKSSQQAFHSCVNCDTTVQYSYKSLVDNFIVVTFHTNTAFMNADKCLMVSSSTGTVVHGVEVL